MAPFDYYSAAWQMVESEKRRPKKYRNCGLKYCGVGYYRGAKYGKLLPETGYMYFTTQAWRVLQKCWLGFKIAKSQADVKNMKYYAEGIRKAQKELGLEVESFSQLGLYASDIVPEQASEMHWEKADYDDYAYESEAQRRWKQKMEVYYY